MPVSQIPESMPPTMTPLLRSDPAFPTSPGRSTWTSCHLFKISTTFSSSLNQILLLSHFYLKKKKKKKKYIYIYTHTHVFISHSPRPKLIVPFRHERTPRRNILGDLQLFISEAVESSLPWGTFPGHSPAVVPRPCPLADESSSHSTTCSCLLAAHLAWGYYATQMLTSELAGPLCPHFCLDTRLWRLISPSSEVIHTGQQL